MKVEEEYNNKPNITVDNFSKILPDFDSKITPVKYWFINFELNASAYGWSEQQKYVQAWNKMIATAKLFIETINFGEFK